MFGLIYQAVYRFFTVFSGPLNSTEKDQPPPLEVEREHLEQRIALIDRAIKKHRELVERINKN